jgi:hypothetical protein
VLPKPEVDEEMWPMPNDLKAIPNSELDSLKISILRIVQKNSARKRGDEWGHAFFLQFRLD